MKRWVFLEKTGEIVLAVFWRGVYHAGPETPYPGNPGKDQLAQENVSVRRSAGPATMTEPDELHPNATREQVY